MIEKNWALIMFLFFVAPVTFAGEVLDNPETPETGIADKIIEQQFLRNRTRGNDSIDEERYLCIAEKATGFNYNSHTKSWETANFIIDGAKYLITKSNYTMYKLDLKTIGNQKPSCHSERGFNEYGFAFFKCPSFQLFKMNNKTGRYIYVYTAGYINGDDTKNTPYIEIGKCSPF